MLLGIDRLDYIKGIPHKLYAYERFFEENPSWIDKVVLVQIAVPSRTKVDEYIRLKRVTHELVGHINGRFGSLSSVPIHYLDQSIPFDELCALYCVADAALISSVRDGMNLVAFEYTACQAKKEHKGVLILSEFAGAAQSLGAGCIQVNPWSVSDISEAILYALSMKKEEKASYHEFAFSYVERYTAKHWARTFVGSLREQSDAMHERYNEKGMQHVPVMAPRLNDADVLTAFERSKHRVIITGLAAMLGSRGAGHAPTSVSDSVRASIQTLAAAPNTTFLIITSHSRRTCIDLLGETDAWLSADNGWTARHGGHNAPWKNMYEHVDLSWMAPVFEVIEHYTVRTPRSFFRTTDTTISWYYRDCEPHLGKRQANDLCTHLTGGPLSNTSTQVTDLAGIITVQPLGITKLSSCRQMLHVLQKKKNAVKQQGRWLLPDSDEESGSDRGRGSGTDSDSELRPPAGLLPPNGASSSGVADVSPVDFFLCLGDFSTTDEELFTFLRGEAVSQARAPSRGRQGGSHGSALPPKAPPVKSTLSGPVAHDWGASAVPVESRRSAQPRSKAKRHNRTTPEAQNLEQGGAVASSSETAAERVRGKKKQYSSLRQPLAHALVEEQVTSHAPPPTVFCATVGAKLTRAGHYIESLKQLETLLAGMAGSCEKQAWEAASKAALKSEMQRMLQESTLDTLGSSGVNSPRPLSTPSPNTLPRQTVGLVSQWGQAQHDPFQTWD